ncbi:MAG: Response regulator receiver protein [Candidatus Sulfotelmatobacter sp.]|nr:Response regulator receiver protein [Candidatus Sulfotelmatobacter sp.]
MEAKSELILLVDDEPNVLLGYERILRNEFKTHSAVGGADALNSIRKRGPYALVLSDMRMPDMDGIQFLTEVKSLAPDTTRIILSGYADVKTALSAVNEGNVFRFLTKPCSKEVLASTLTAGIGQYRLIMSEKELLEKTLMGCLTVLNEVLSMASPTAFSRAIRLRRYMAHIMTALATPNRWKFEFAAMLSQLACVTMVPESIDDIYSGKQLPAKEQALYNLHPSIASDLLKTIPRMESIAWMIAHQHKAITVDGDIRNREMAEMRLGAELLQIILAFDTLVRRGSSRTEAAYKITRRHPDLDSRIFMALVEVDPDDREKEKRTCSVEELCAGMIIDQEIRTDGGSLIIARNQEVTPFLILKLKNYHEKGAIIGDVAVLAPKTRAASAI